MNTWNVCGKKLNPLKFCTRYLHLTYIQFRDFMVASPHKFLKLFNMLKACRQCLNINYRIYAHSKHLIWQLKLSTGHLYISFNWSENVYCRHNTPTLCERKFHPIDKLMFSLYIASKFSRSPFIRGRHLTSSKSTRSFIQAPLIRQM